MQKIFSARIDEAALNEMERATRRLKMSKRQFLEEAIRLRAEQAHRQKDDDVWTDTLGAWQRAERATTTIARARRAFQRTFDRHQEQRRARVHR